MSATFGIDFGTSNSALSVNIDGRVRLLAIDPENPITNSLKSILYFLKEDGQTSSFVGYEGVKKYIENEADGRYMQSIKTFLPDTGFEKTSIYGQFYTLEQLISIFLKVMKQRGQQIIKQEVTDLVLGRPVIFSKDKKKDRIAQDRLLCAAKLAGFKNVCFQLEPIAAALAYENSLGTDIINATRKEQVVLVGDFGAGSSDEKTKCQLSDQDESQIYFNDYDICIDERLSLNEFEDLIKEKVDAINACIDSTLKMANLSSQDIDVVFLTGGSSYIPLIRGLFEKRIGPDKIRSADAFTSVAYGLGLQGNLMG